MMKSKLGNVVSDDDENDDYDNDDDDDGFDEREGGYLRCNSSTLHHQTTMFRQNNKMHV